MPNVFLEAGVGFLTGIISGFGIGGGSLLVLYLTAVQGVAQIAAQGINLVYFLFCAPGALVVHIKEGLVEKKAVVVCALAGALTSVLFAFIAASLDLDLLRRGFGVLILVIGAKELFCKNPKKNPKKRAEKGE